MTDTYGPTSPQPFAYYDPDGSSWRTSQGTFPWDSTPSSPIWPKRGSMRSGACFEHPTWAPATSGHACSSLLGTPTARDHKDGASIGSWPVNGQLGRQVWQFLPTPVVNDMGEGKTPEAWDEWTQVMQEKHGNGNGHGRSLAIEAMRLLPTPITQHRDRNTPEAAQDRRDRGHQDELATVVALLGEDTSRPSDDGKPPSDDPPPDLLTTLDD